VAARFVECCVLDKFGGPRTGSANHDNNNRPPRQMETHAPFEVAIAQADGCVSPWQLVSLHFLAPSRYFLQLVPQKFNERT